MGDRFYYCADCYMSTDDHVFEPDGSFWCRGYDTENCDCHGEKGEFDETSCNYN